MSPEPFDPNFQIPPEDTPAGGRTDLSSLHAAPDAVGPPSLSSPVTPKAKALPRTDFQSLAGPKYGQVKYRQRRTWTDWLIEVLTPLMIFIMVYSVIFFLLDVRYVYTEVNDVNLRFVVFCFVMGVVALNRLIARDGSGESMLYMGGLALAIGFYTFATTGAYDMGSVARNFMNDNAYLATAFNMCIVAFVWWLVNRLTHECCVDENRTAGDVGILTGTARRIQSALKGEPEPLPKKKARRSAEDIAPMYELEAFDPLDGYKPKAKPPVVPRGTTADRLAKRHPGMSIFYFSVPVMFIFAVGLRVVQHGGPAMVLAGQFYMGVYTVTALSLLLLTSLGGVREYFRARKVDIPAGIGVFWVGLGIVMIAVVLVGAAQLPKPSLPAMAAVDQHQIDFWSRTSTFKLSAVSATPVELLQQSKFMERVGQAVLVVLALFLAYSALKSLGSVAAWVGRHRYRFPRFVVRFFDLLDRVLAHLTQVPHLPKRKPRVRIQRDIATSTRYSSSLGDPASAGRMTVQDHIQHAYNALCALAYDLGVPRQIGQTPYEFLNAFPRELHGLHEEAEDLTRLYVIAAYSPDAMDDRVLDRLRKFWITYGRVRNRVVR